MKDYLKGNPFSPLDYTRACPQIILSHLIAVSIYLDNVIVIARSPSTGSDEAIQRSWIYPFGA